MNHARVTQGVVPLDRRKRKKNDSKRKGGERRRKEKGGEPHSATQTKQGSLENQNASNPGPSVLGRDSW